MLRDGERTVGLGESLEPIDSSDPRLHSVLSTSSLEAFQAYTNGERMVLSGDAAHAVHFSVGSGTMLALEDAIALVASINACGDLPKALLDFEETRKPVLDTFQTLERVTVDRLERMERLVGLEPLEVAYQLLSR